MLNASSKTRSQLRTENAALGGCTALDVHTEVFLSIGHCVTERGVPSDLKSQDREAWRRLVDLQNRDFGNALCSPGSPPARQPACQGEGEVAGSQDGADFPSPLPRCKTSLGLGLTALWLRRLEQYSRYPL